MQDPAGKSRRNGGYPMSTEITVNVHSSIRIAGADTVIRIDPFKIADEPHDADLICITHGHYDHFSPEDILRVSKPDTVIAAPKNMEKQLAKLGIKTTVLFAPGESRTVQGIPVETVAAYNLLKPFHTKASGCLGYILTVDGQRIYAAGDTDAVAEAKAVRCDTALVPIGGTYTMNPKEAAALVNTIHPKTVIPVHYGMIAGKLSDGEKFRDLVADGIEVKLLLTE
jgi:L-ascorbate metabolism protein UlaG (beta-lactamase superfamily)